MNRRVLGCLISTALVGLVLSAPGDVAAAAGSSTMKRLLASLRIVLLLCALVLFAAIALLTSTAAPAPASSASVSTIVTANVGRIAIGTVIHTPSGFDKRIYTMNADGSELKQSEYVGEDPTWSPDASEIAYVAPTDADRCSGWIGQEIWAMDGNLAWSSQVTCGEEAFSPSWSPDSGKLAFFDISDGWNIEVMNADGSGGKTSLAALGNAWSPSAPVWSPDSSKIAYDQYDNPLRLSIGIYVMNAVDGSNKIRLTAAGTMAFSPAWSSDNKIAFDGTGGQIFLMNADGTGIKPLGRWNCGGSLSWSPDGSKIAYSDCTEKNVYVVNADGSHSTRLMGFPDGTTIDRIDWQRPMPVAGDTLPTVTCALPDGVWHASDVAISCHASSEHSDLNDADKSFTLSTQVPQGSELMEVPTGTRVICDLAGSCTLAGPVLDNYVDKKAPTIVISSPVNGANYVLHRKVSARYSVAEGGSGFGSYSPEFPPKQLTASVGRKSFTVHASDKVGNVSRLSVRYAVVYGQRQLTTPFGNMVKLRLIDARYKNVSSAKIALIVRTLDGHKPRSSDPSRFIYSRDSAAYFVLLPYRSGTHKLTFTAGDDPSVHLVKLQVNCAGTYICA